MSSDSQLLSDYDPDEDEGLQNFLALLDLAKIVSGDKEARDRYDAKHEEWKKNNPKQWAADQKRIKEIEERHNGR